eukprot:6783645-Pyramimonas_sp.AAC.1
MCGTQQRQKRRGLPLACSSCSPCLGRLGGRRGAVCEMCDSQPLGFYSARRARDHDQVGE